MSVSCESFVEVPDSVSEDGKFYETIDIYLDEPMTKVNESSITEATLFFYQKIGDGDYTFYDRIYVNSNSARVNIIYYSQMSVSYKVVAYANMGNLSSEPTSASIAFSNELDGLQSRGEGTFSRQTTLTLPMKRWINNIDITGIYFNLDPYMYQGTYPEINAIWLAEIPSAVSGGTVLNSDGNHSATVYNDLIYKEFKFVTSGTSGYAPSEPISLYFYGSSARVVLRAKINGLTQYYSFIASGFSENSRATYELTINQEGSTKPLGALPSMMTVTGGTGKPQLFEPTVDQTTSSGYEIQPFWIRAQEDGMTVTNNRSVTLYYKINDDSWNILSSYATTPSVNTGSKIYFKGYLTGQNSNPNYSKGLFTINKKCSIGGDLRSLVGSDNFEDYNDLTSCGNYLFSQLFLNCTTIVSAYYLDLIADNIPEACCYQMFKGCNNMTQGPNMIGIKNLSSYCFYEMFKDCSSLLYQSEVEYWDNLYEYCYYHMFENCSSLVGYSDCTYGKGHILPATVIPSYAYSGMYINCDALEAVRLAPYEEIAFGDYACSSMFAQCDNLYFVDFTCSSVSQYCCNSMFYNCTSLDVTSLIYMSLKADELAYQCFSAMFYGCTSLTDCSYLDLPATKLAGNCYDSMFEGCTSLTYGPELPALSLEYECYNEMFMNCTSLKAAPEILATTAAEWACYMMFAECVNLTTPNSVLATTLKSGCFGGMFFNCKKLTESPLLPALNLVSDCYNSMFMGCSSLKIIKAMFATSPSKTYTSNWVSGVSSSGTFVKNSAATWSNTFGTNAIPSGWTVILDGN